MEMFIWVAVIVTVVTLALMAVVAAARRSLRDGAMKWMDEIGITAYRIAFNTGDAIGVDYNGRRVAVSAGGENNLIPFENLISVEVVEDGVTVNKVNRGSQAIGAAVGAAALGGVGAIIGGLSGSSTSKEKVSKASFNIITSLPDAPFTEVKVFHEQPTDRNGFVYKQLTSDLMPWYGRLRAIVEQS